MNQQWTPKPRPVIPTRASLGPGAAPGAGPPRPRRGAHARRFPLPPPLGKDRHLEAVYLLDTGVGTAFAYVNKLELLAEHYGEQLTYVDSVELEWRRHATMQLHPLRPGHTQLEKETRDQLAHLKAAGQRLCADAASLFGDAVITDEDDQDAIDGLVADLCALHPPKADSGADRGECASVHIGMRLRATRPVVVLCANDDRARKLAANRGLAHRNMHTILTEMVREQRLTETEAHDLYSRMSQVTKLPEHARPESAGDFS